MKKAAFFNGPDPLGATDNIERIFADRQRQIAAMTTLHPVIVTLDNLDSELDKLEELEVIFSTWNMMKLTAEQLDRLPNLKAVFYAAGTVKYFAEPLLERGVTVCCALAANAIPVAEFALAQVLLSGAGYWRNSRECLDETSANMASSYRGFGNYGGRVSILGNGSVSNNLQEYLKPHNLDVLVIPAREANRTVSLEEAFETSFAVVNLFPGREDNQKVFGERHFRSMMDGAVFINVGRGQQVDEDALLRVLKDRPDCTALLDVQWPEPPVNGSELYTLPNVQLSAHLAGSKSAEFIRMADFMMDEFKRFEAGEPLEHEVTMEKFNQMA